MVPEHIPVLKSEVLEFLKVEKNKKYIDATVGGGGHAEAILKKGGLLLGIDQDEEVLKRTSERLSRARPKDACLWRLAQGNFVELEEIAKKNGFSQVDGILFDLGLSTYQLQSLERGFSFKSEFLDMRMDPDHQKVKASDLINGLTEGELYELFTKFGEEHRARQIARVICLARRIKPIQHSSELVKIIENVYGKTKGRIHAATKIFQSLRIAVNDELNNLKQALPQAINLLRPEGRLVILSFHSLEDRIVKNFIKDKEKLGRIKILTKKPIRPNINEIMFNPRSRSAKLRVAEKI